MLLTFLIQVILDIIHFSLNVLRRSKSPCFHSIIKFNLYHMSTGLQIWRLDLILLQLKIIANLLLNDILRIVRDNKAILNIWEYIIIIICSIPMFGLSHHTSGSAKHEVNPRVYIYMHCCSLYHSYHKSTRNNRETVRYRVLVHFT